MEFQIWNKIVALKLFFVCFFEMDVWSLSLFFLALVALKCICCVFRFENVSWAGVALKIFFVAFLFEFFLALIASKMIFCSCRFETDFLLLLLWKLFLAPVALKNVCRLPLWKLFFVLFPLNLILGASRFEIFLVVLWKCLFGGHCFENSFLALVVLKIVFWQLSLFEHFCACSCEDVSCPRVFENDIMSLLALKIFILLSMIVIWKNS